MMEQNEEILDMADAAEGEEILKMEGDEDVDSVEDGDESGEDEVSLRAQQLADERIARSGVMNPVTGRPFQSMEELERYGEAQRQAALQRMMNRNQHQMVGSREFLRRFRENEMALTAERTMRAAAESRSRRSTGSGGKGGEMLSAAQRASLDAWNRDNPDMKMTARQFLAK